MMCRLPWLLFAALCCAGLSSLAPAGTEPSCVTFDTTSQRVSANISDQRLIEVLGKLASATGWHIFVEPDSNPAITTSFDELPVGQALRTLLGNLNYALVRETDVPSRLYVFHTSRANATRRVEASPEDGTIEVVLRRVGNELIVTVKPGTDIEALAASLGAKVIAQLGDQPVYRLRFEDDAAAASAREQLASDSRIASVDYNYYVDRPEAPRSTIQQPQPPVQLSMKTPAADGAVVIGLVDTQIQSLCGDLNGFILPAKSLAGNSVPPDGSLAHATAMAETILRSIQRVSPEGSAVRILPVDVYGANANATSFDIASGIVLAVNNGANIVNLSLGSYGGAGYLEKVIQAASAKGVAFFGAAGNEPVTNPVFPAAYADVIAVTAAMGNQLAPYANRGGFVDMAAPGMSTVCFNGQPYMIQGTSAASAWAAGFAAGLADRQGLTPAQASQATAQRYAVSFSPQN